MKTFQHVIARTLIRHVAEANSRYASPIRVNRESRCKYRAHKATPQQTHAG